MPQYNDGVGPDQWFPNLGELRNPLYTHRMEQWAGISKATPAEKKSLYWLDLVTSNSLGFYALRKKQLKYALYSNPPLELSISYYNKSLTFIQMTFA